MRAYRTLRRDASEHSVRKQAAGAALRNREQRFLDGLDELVWPFPESPARRLLEVAGADRHDVAVLVGEAGLEGALEELRERGVYVSYEESLGRVPAQRGSTILELSPGQFANPVAKPDFLVSTGGTRSEGIQAQSNFGYIRHMSSGLALQLEAWGVHRAPSAVWLPVFPGGGMYAVLQYIGAGNALERWFSQIELGMPGVAPHKRFANRATVAAAVLTRGGMPRPRFVPPTEPEPVIEWLRGALARSGRALTAGYASSWTRLALVAAEQGVSLRGAVMSLSGETVTAAKAATVQASGARVLNLYAFIPEGIAAVSCPARDRADELHLWSPDFAVITRARTSHDGTEVPALCWTTLEHRAPRVLVNVENDDTGQLRHSAEPCGCLLGELGMRTWLSSPQSVSKVVAGGATVLGEVLQRLADEVLPSRLGGGPTDYQFVEEDRDGTTGVSLRVDPRLGPVDDAAALAVVREALSGTESGLLATALWSSSLRVERAPVLSASSGKVLAFERRG